MSISPTSSKTEHISHECKHVYSIHVYTASHTHQLQWMCPALTQAALMASIPFPSLADQHGDMLVRNKKVYIHIYQTYVSMSVHMCAVWIPPVAELGTGLWILVFPIAGTRTYQCLVPAEPLQVLLCFQTCSDLHILRGVGWNSPPPSGCQFPLVLLPYHTHIRTPGSQFSSPSHPVVQLAVACSHIDSFQVVAPRTHLPLWPVLLKWLALKPPCSHLWTWVHKI